MKITRGISLLGISILTLTGMTPAAAAQNQPQSPISPAAITSESVSPLITEAAAELGIKERLVLWAVQGKSVRIGFSSVTGHERAALQRKLPFPVIVSREDPVVTMDKITKASDLGSPQLVKGPEKDTSSSSSPTLMAATTSPPLIDSTPYYGGARLVRTYSVNGETWVQQCTAGGVYTSGGTFKMATAGHCGQVGTVWNQGYYDTTDKRVYISGTMGNTISSQYGGGAIDAAMLSGNSYAAAIWTSPTSALPIAGQAAVGNGTQICSGGSFTGFVCGGTVDLVDICTIYTDGNTVCGLDRATAAYRLVQGGDSGGPVVVNNGGSSASLAGIISGGTATGTTLYFTHINRVVSTMGVAVAQY